MNGIVISLGSNLGNRRKYLDDALLLIESEVGSITDRSSVIETKSWGFDSGDFLNQVIRIQTTLPPMELLDKLQEIERRLGRAKKRASVYDESSYSDRTIDLDILYYNDYQTDNKRLTLPHPKIKERTFMHSVLKEIHVEF